ncbi:MAG: competence/damage-inducible protein A [Boseongicola sp. SB0676_bin_33]|uniref:Competence/damage-inducible protein A n=1 Tax=Boseongicola sp. SB0664_bin_43 TaxID=2604844 RepID=A0A6B0XYA0_9RHOB|nr:competence/damage-inducible protein A [Boseongicola sp. SB0664_bin_43]MYF88919.1 competence/damage-inducible protein A [Boseongicola sp. SB0676_bin_33]MYK32491.1 competence/damage-inducible protein A [Boseongicola sp. SB0670_bin_30]
MANPTAAMLVIGDEILSGRTRDSNMHHLAGRLTEAGINLMEVRMVADDRKAIVKGVKALARNHDHLFTSGGIGPTHDDITADCVAEAMDASIDVRPDARAILQAHYDRQGIEMNEARLRMARIPEGATLIENPISAAPGFTIGNVHVMAGIPAIFEAMVAGILPAISGGDPVLSESIRIDRAEGDIATRLGELAEEFADLTFGSYPFRQSGQYGAHVVIRGTDPRLINHAATQLRAAFGDDAS